MTDYTDEEGLLIIMRASKLCLKIAKLTWNWNNYPEPVNEGYELMDQVRKLSLEISDYQQRIGSKLNQYHKNKITNAITDLEILLPYMENKMNSIKIGAFG